MWYSYNYNKMAEFKYKGFEVEINKRSDGLFTWTAYDTKSSTLLGDREGGELSTYSNAKYTIKRWIAAFKSNKYVPQDIVIRK